jgi:hypothetical protein
MKVVSYLGERPVIDRPNGEVLKEIIGLLREIAETYVLMPEGTKVRVVAVEEPPHVGDFPDDPFFEEGRS